MELFYLVLLIITGAALMLHIESCAWHVEVVEQSRPMIRADFTHGLWWRYCKLISKLAVWR